MALDDIPPLPIGVPIVDPKTGAATREFAQWWQQMFGNQGTLDADKVPAGNVGASGLTMATNKLLGRQSADTGAIEELSASEALEFLGSAAQGDIIYRGASGFALLPAGTSGHYLKTNGAAADPAWAAVSGGGGWTLIDTYDYDTDGSFSTRNTTVTIDDYTQIIVEGIISSSTSTDASLRVSTDGTTFLTSGYNILDTSGAVSTASSVLATSGASSSAKSFAWRIMKQILNSGTPGNGRIVCINELNDATSRAFVSDSTFAALQVRHAAGSITAGSYRIWGIS